ncbi:MAG: metal-dependent hydrolase [Candidatus Hodarchaeota archaeon]
MNTMPDWLSHLGLAYVFSFVPGVINEEQPHEHRVLLFIGSVMLDFSRPFSLIAIYFLDYNTAQLLGQFSYLSLHSIIGALLLAGLLSPLFFNYSFKQAYFLLILGGFSHLLLDMTMWPWTGGVLLFFPLQTQRYSFRLIWPGNYYIPLLFGLPLTSLAFFHLLRDFKKSRGIVQENLS